MSETTGIRQYWKLIITTAITAAVTGIVSNYFNKEKLTEQKVDVSEGWKQSNEKLYDEIKNCRLENIQLQAEIQVNQNKSIRSNVQSNDGTDIQLNKISNSKLLGSWLTPDETVTWIFETGNKVSVKGLRIFEGIIEAKGNYKISRDKLTVNLQTSKLLYLPAVYNYKVEFESNPQVTTLFGEMVDDYGEVTSLVLNK